MIHKNLDIWKRSMNLVLDIYTLTQTFPSYERYGLSSQMRRAAVSIPSNIAEGAARKSSKELKQFLHISIGSLAELETQLLIAAMLGYPCDNKTKIQQDMNEIRKMIQAIISKINT